jgi:hypothetical protein
MLYRQQDYQGNASRILAFQAFGFVLGESVVNVALQEESENI